MLFFALVFCVFMTSVANKKFLDFLFVINPSRTLLIFFGIVHVPWQTCGVRLVVQRILQSFSQSNLSGFLTNYMSVPESINVQLFGCLVVYTFVCPSSVCLHWDINHDLDFFFYISLFRQTLTCHTHVRLSAGVIFSLAVKLSIWQFILQSH